MLLLRGIAMIASPWPLVIICDSTMKLIEMRLNMLLVVLNLSITLTVSLRSLAWRVCFVGLHRAVC